MFTATERITRAEELFEAACDARGIKYRRIVSSRVLGRQRPDYRVEIAQCGAIVEVKQIDPNEADLRHAAQLAAGQVAGFDGQPGARLRKKIKEAANQLRQASKLGVPTAVAVYDATSSLRYTDPQHVKNAMFGLDQMVIGVPQDVRQEPYFIRMKLGGKRTMTETENTSISAVLVIQQIPTEHGLAPEFFAYLNPYARVPIEEAHLKGYVFGRFALGEWPSGKTEWVDLDRPPDHR